MKNLFFTVLLILLSFSLKANDPDLFKLEYESIQQEFAGLQQLTDLLADNPELTLTSLMENNASLAEAANLSPVVALPTTLAEPYLGVPSFLWGCCLGPVGLLVVYLQTDKNMDETKKAVWGCVVGSAVGLIALLLF